MMMIHVYSTGRSTTVQVALLDVYFVYNNNVFIYIYIHVHNSRCTRNSIFCPFFLSCLFSFHLSSCRPPHLPFLFCLSLSCPSCPFPLSCPFSLCLSFSFSFLQLPPPPHQTILGILHLLLSSKHDQWSTDFVRTCLIILKQEKKERETRTYT